MSQPSPSQIRVARDGNVIGNFSLANLGQALRDKTVLPTDHYWRGGNANWERVSYIAEEAEEAVARTMPQVVPPPPNKSKGRYAYLFMGIGLFLFLFGMSASKYGVVIGYTTTPRAPGVLFPVYKYPIWPQTIVPLCFLTAGVLWVIGWRRRKL